MISVGRTFDDGSWEWADLYAFIFASQPGTAVFHKVERGWTTTDYRLADVIDVLQIIAWQRTEGAHERPPRDMPAPVRRPFDPVPEDSPTAPLMGGYVATKMTVGDFLTRRLEREKRWRKRNGIPEPEGG